VCGGENEGKAKAKRNPSEVCFVAGEDARYNKEPESLEEKNSLCFNFFLSLEVIISFILYYRFREFNCYLSLFIFMNRKSSGEYF
jgi:hypothetical protein